MEGLYGEGFSDMAAWRRAIELSLGETDLEKLRLIARSRTEAASRVERARILLGYCENSSFFAVGDTASVSGQLVLELVRVLPARDDDLHGAREPRQLVRAGVRHHGERERRSAAVHRAAVL